MDHSLMWKMNIYSTSQKIQSTDPLKSTWNKIIKGEPSTLGSPFLYLKQL